MIKAIFYKEWIKMRCFYPLSALFLFGATAWLGLVLGAFYALIRRRSPGGRLWQTVGVVLFGLFLFVPLLVFGTAKR